jgi:hypothetical protein
VQLCTVFARVIGNTLDVDLEPVHVMPSLIAELDATLTELRKQGLTVGLHSRQNNTWHIGDGGVYSGYIASEEELLELKRTAKLNIRGIKDLG